MAKQFKYAEDARKALEKGVDTLANTVKLPSVPKAAMWFGESSAPPHHQ